MLLLTSCTSVYKQAQKQTYFSCLYLCVVLFLSHLVLRCTNRHQNKPISSCLCLWVGAFSRILYFDVQPGTKTNLFLVVYVYGMVLFLASCTSMYKQAPKQTFLVVNVYGVVLLLASCTSPYKQAPTQAYLTGV